jgi:raffinose/stachyose/melibiose transport system permease protein
MIKRAFTNRKKQGWRPSEPSRSHIDNSSIVVTIFIAIGALITLAPCYFILVTALKSPMDRAQNPFGLPTVWQWSNFSKAIALANLPKGFLISLIITGSVLVLLPFIASAAAYPLARRNRGLNHAVYILFLSGLVLSPSLAMVPLISLMVKLNLAKTLYGIILLYLAFGLPFSIFLYSGFIKSIPRELDDAARIDGCNQWNTFRLIIFPLLKPATATVLVFNGLVVWNDFFWPLLFLNSIETRTLILRVFSFQSQYSAQWELIFAGSILALLPILILYLVMQRQFVAGISAGAFK